MGSSASSTLRSRCSTLVVPKRSFSQSFRANVVPLGTRILLAAGITSMSIFGAEWAHRARLKEEAEKGIVRTRAQMRKEGEIVTYALIGANVLLFGLSTLPAMKAAVFRHFSVHMRSSAFSMLGSAFMHGTPAHLLFNMVALFSFGPTVAQVFGTEHFLGLYTASAAVSALASLALSHKQRNIFRASVGASGSIWALISALSFVAPHMQLQFIFFPFISFPAWGLVPALAAFDLVGLMGLVPAINRMGLDHAGHVGGMLYGLAFTYALYVHRRRIHMNARRRS